MGRFQETDFILNQIRKLLAYENLFKDLGAGVLLPGLGLMRSARLPVLAALQRDLQVPILLITDRADRALMMLEELQFWMPDVERLHFPEPAPLFYEPASWGIRARRDRLQVLATFANYFLPSRMKPNQNPVVVAPLRALMTRTLPRRDFIKNIEVLRIGITVQQNEIISRWSQAGYQYADTVLELGYYSRRGGILDIWPSASSQPVRFDFFGDELDTLRFFDPATQRTTQKLDQVVIPPAREILPDKSPVQELLGQDIAEFFLPIAYPFSGCLFDFLPSNTLVLVDNLDNLESMATEVEEQAIKLRSDSIAEGTLEENFPEPYFTWSELLDNLSGHLWVELGRSSADEISLIGDAFAPGLRFGGQLKNVSEHLANICNASEGITVISRQSNRLKGLWGERQGDHLPCLPPVFMEGTLSEGWVLTLPDQKTFHLLTDSEIFGWDRPHPRSRVRRVAEAPEAQYADLKPGDWVVHVDYGVGTYTGLVQRTIDGSEKEYLCVEYEGGDQLFVPVHQADRLTRYIGTDSRLPNPDRLGGVEWIHTRERVKESVQVAARELLEIYANRQIAKGYAFSADSAWQQDLESSFPYIETQDQLRAIADVKSDMEKARPMDRLLCGDVGYGKTEVALRAAFKAVMDGKQVAILVPTTVLAQQHYETFRQRLMAFPVMVEMLSRFRTHREQSAILARLELGGVDIIIGTHRLLQQDVRFNNLGLVIIDEEQRFGVIHKEYFKRLRTEIDVLTMTATPIPRTLYMALTNVRDISTIETPPDERLPIITHIGPYSPRLVRQAILREMERGGQVFFVHNRVQTIGSMQKHLNKLVPEARTSLAHGQMHENALSEVMLSFSRGEIDVLLCTSIIESGLDIPNANTLIVDRGDTFGLAQLYQLRGRVGRGAQRAYAYFFRHSRRAPTPEGKERLEVIAENTQLGAGYSIAMRDLEMRGAGELLGVRQHGNIAAVGFHLYTRLLGQAVKGLRTVMGMEEQMENRLSLHIESHLPVTVELPLSVEIPPSYVPEQDMRLRLYRRLAGKRSEEDIFMMLEEFKDRFGPPPESVLNLFYQMRVKLLAKKAGIVSVAIEGDQLVLRFAPQPDNLASRNLPDVGGGSRAGKNAYWIPFQRGEDEWKTRLLNILSNLVKRGVHDVS